MPDIDALRASTDPYLPDSRAQLSADPGIAFREAMRQSQMGFSFVGTDGRILSANPAMAGLTGYSPTELVGMSTETLTPDEDRETLGAAEAALMSGATNLWTRRRRVVRKDGTSFWADLTANPVRAYNGQIVGILGVMEDVTKEVTAALRLQAAESGWLSLIRDSPSSFALLDLEGRIAEVNKATCRVFGTTPAQMIGRVAVDFVVPSDRPVVLAKLAKVTQGTPIDLKTRGLRLDGTSFWLSANVSPIRGPGGDLIGVGGFFRDVSTDIEEQRTRSSEREELEVQQREYRLLATNMNDVVMLTQELRIWWASPSIRQFGYADGELHGRSTADLVHPDDVYLLLSERDRIERDLPTRFRLRSKDGQYHWVEAITRPYGDPGGPPSGFVTTLRAIERKMHLEQELAAREAEFRVLAGTSGDVIIRVDANERRVWVSASVQEVLGVSQQEFLSHSDDHYTHPHDRAESNGLREEYVRTHADGFAMPRLRLRRADGEYSWVSAQSKRLPDGGRIITLRVIEAEVRLQDAVAGLQREVLASAHRGGDVLTLWTDDAVAWVSSGPRDPFGFGPDRLTGMTMADLVAEADRTDWDDAVRHAVGSEGAVTCRVRMIGPDTHLVPYEHRMLRARASITAGLVDGAKVGPGSVLVASHALLPAIPEQEGRPGHPVAGG